MTRWTAIRTTILLFALALILLPAPRAAADGRHWIETGSMSSPRYGQTATRLQDGRVLVTGGMDDRDVRLATAEIYDPASGTWVLAASMDSARESPAATRLHDGRVLVAGGFDGQNYLASAEIYNPASGTWSPAGSMTKARYEQTATRLLDGRVLVAGEGPGADPRRPPTFTIPPRGGGVGRDP